MNVRDTYKAPFILVEQAQISTFALMMKYSGRNERAQGGALRRKILLWFDFCLSLRKPNSMCLWIHLLSVERCVCFSSVGGRAGHGALRGNQ